MEIKIFLTGKEHQYTSSKLLLCKKYCTAKKHSTYVLMAISERELPKFMLRFKFRRNALIQNVSLNPYHLFKWMENQNKPKSDAKQTWFTLKTQINN